VPAGFLAIPLALSVTWPGMIAYALNPNPGPSRRRLSLSDQHVDPCRPPGSCLCRPDRGCSLDHRLSRQLDLLAAHPRYLQASDPEESLRPSTGPFRPAIEKRGLPQGKGAYPATDSILARALSIGVGVVDAGLGAGFGINIPAAIAEMRVRNLAEPSPPIVIPPVYHLSFQRDNDRNRSEKALGPDPGNHADRLGK